jgi:hypothetical protein
LMWFFLAAVEVKPQREIALKSSGIPDMRYINRKLSIAEVAAALDIRSGQSGNLHCWHPERHQNGDRTASVGVRKINNKVKCFGCDSKPMGPIDLVMDVLNVEPADAALWISNRFPVPEIPKGKNLENEDLPRWQVGLEDELGVLIRSGLWAQLSEATRVIAPVLVQFAENNRSTGTARVQMSYRAITRYSGIKSPNAIRRALRELNDFGWLELPGLGTSLGPGQPTAAYVITPHSDQLMEHANLQCKQEHTEIEIEREVRRRRRGALLKTDVHFAPPHS